MAIGIVDALESADSSEMFRVPHVAPAYAQWQRGMTRTLYAVLDVRGHLARGGQGKGERKGLDLEEALRE